MKGRNETYTQNTLSLSSSEVSTKEADSTAGSTKWSLGKEYSDKRYGLRRPWN